MCLIRRIFTALLFIWSQAGVVRADCNELHLREFTEHTVCGLYGRDAAGEWLRKNQTEYERADIGEWFKSIASLIVPLNACQSVVDELRQFQRAQCESLFAFLFRQHTDLSAFAAARTWNQYALLMSGGLGQKFEGFQRDLTALRQRPALSATKPLRWHTKTFSALIDCLLTLPSPSALTDAIRLFNVAKPLCSLTDRLLDSAKQHATLALDEALMYNRPCEYELKQRSEMAPLIVEAFRVLIEIDNLGIFIPIEREKEYAITDKDVRYELLRTVLAISPQNRRMFYALVRKKFPNGVMHCAINGPLGQRAASFQRLLLDAIEAAKVTMPQLRVGNFFGQQNLDNIFAQTISTREVRNGQLDGVAIVRQLLEAFRLAQVLYGIPETNSLTVPELEPTSRLALCNTLFQLMLWAFPEEDWAEIVNQHRLHRLPFMFHTFYCAYIQASVTMRSVVELANPSAELKHNLLEHSQESWAEVLKEMQKAALRWEIANEIRIIAQLVSTQIFAREILNCFQQNDPKESISIAVPFVASLVSKLKLTPKTGADSLLNNLIAFANEFSVQRPMLVFNELLRYNWRPTGALNSDGVSCLMRRLRIQLQMFKRVFDVYNDVTKVSESTETNSTCGPLSVEQTLGVVRLSSIVLFHSQSASEANGLMCENNAHTEALIQIMDDYKAQIQPSVLACFFSNIQVFSHENNASNVSFFTQLKNLRGALNVYCELKRSGHRLAGITARQIVGEVAGLTSLSQSNICTDLIHKIAHHFESKM